MELLINFNNEINNIINDKLLLNNFMQVNPELIASALTDEESYNIVIQFYNNLLRLMNINDNDYISYSLNNIIKLSKKSDTLYKLLLIALKSPAYQNIIILNSEKLFDTNIKFNNLRKVLDARLSKINSSSIFFYILIDKDELIKDPSTAEILLFDLINESIDIRKYFIILNIPHKPEVSKNKIKIKKDITHTSASNNKKPKTSVRNNRDYDTLRKNIKKSSLLKNVKNKPLISVSNVKPKTKKSVNKTSVMTSTAYNKLYSSRKVTLKNPVLTTKLKTRLK